jgi:uncharacterized protein YndB with AHSA1/START domain
MLGKLEQVDRGWQLRFVRELAHPPARVWQALTEPDELRSWFPDQVIIDEWKVGAKLRFEDANAGIEPFDGEVLAFQPPALLEFRWGTDTIRFEVSPRDSGSVLTLIDTIDELGKAARDGAGWHACLDALEHALDGKPAPDMSGRWAAIHGDYVKAWGPDASTIGPPEAWNRQADAER